MADLNTLAVVLLGITIVASIALTTIVAWSLVSGSYRRYLKKRNAHEEQLDRIRKQLNKDESSDD